MVEHYVPALRKCFLEDMRTAGLNTCRSSIPSALKRRRSGPRSAVAGTVRGNHAVVQFRLRP